MERILEIGELGNHIYTSRYYPGSLVSCQFIKEISRSTLDWYSRTKFV